MAPDSDHLQIRFQNDRQRIQPGQMLTFGRQADLCVDSGNPLLHPEMGRFEHRTGLWWLVNTGRDIWIELHDLEAESWVPLAPGREIAISTPRTAVRFSAGPADYELDVSLGPV